MANQAKPVNHVADWSSSPWELQVFWILITSQLLVLTHHQGIWEATHREACNGNHRVVQLNELGKVLELRGGRVAHMLTNPLDIRGLRLIFANQQFHVAQILWLHLAEGDDSRGPLAHPWHIRWQDAMSSTFQLLPLICVNETSPTGLRPVLPVFAARLDTRDNWRFLASDIVPVGTSSHEPADSLVPLRTSIQREDLRACQSAELYAAGPWSSLTQQETRRSDTWWLYTKTENGDATLQGSGLKHW